MKKISLVLLLSGVLSGLQSASAQVIIRGGGVGMGRMYRRSPRPPREELPKFDPVVHVSVGYGFPNLDKMELPELYNYYRGSYSQTGPLTASVDYQFNRNMSIGVLVTHGKVSVPYYGYNNASTPALNGSLDNWGIMLNIMRYLPVSGNKVTPYIRTAIGINSWQQEFTDANGGKVNLGLKPNDLAYQVGLGARFNVFKKAGLFVEAGYGKYILHGGLSVRL